MKRHFLKPGAGLPFMGNKFMKAGRAFNGGSGGGATEADIQAEKLVGKFKDELRNSLKQRGFAEDGDTVDSLIDKALKKADMDPTQMRELPGNMQKLNAEIEKLKQRQTVHHEKQDVETLMRAWVKENNDELTENLKAKDGTKNWEMNFQIRAAAVMTTLNIVDNDVIPQDILDSFSLGGFVEKRYGVPYVASIANIATVADIEKYKVWLEEGNVEGGFAIVAEGGLKPLVSGSVVRNISEAKKIAAKYVITEEVEKFKQNILNIVVRMIRNQLQRQYEALITTGMQAAAVGYTGTALDGTFATPNDMDAIAAVVAQQQSLNFFPDVLILHPQDLWRIRTTKDSQGNYLYPVITMDGTTTLMGLRIITSTLQTVGNFTVAESGLYQIEQEPLSVRIGYGINVTTSGGNVTAVESDFDHNRKRVILEMWFNDYLATPNIGSIVTASFATVKTALEAA